MRWLVPCGLLTAFLATEAAAKQVSVRMRGGDRVTGELVSETDEETVIEHPVFGRLVVPREKQAPREGEQPGILGSSFLAGWHKEVGLGVTGQEGNSPEANVLLTSALRRTTPDWRYRGSLEYKLGTEGSDRTTNYLDVDHRYDRLFPGSRWFAGFAGSYQYDEFEPWEHRLLVLGGPGYQLFQGERFRLDVLTGPTVSYEFGDRDEVRPEVLVGVELEWEPLDGHELTLRQYLLQGLKENEWRSRTRAEWSMRVRGTEHLNFNVGMDNEYDTAAEDDRINLKYWSSLSYDF